MSSRSLGRRAGFVGYFSPISLTEEVPAQAEQITTFNSSGTLTTQPRTTEIEYLVIAGGGGGGYNGGGGGAGGFLTNFPGGTSNPVSGNTGYPVTIGGGGGSVSGSGNRGGCGSDSTLGVPSPISSNGGGGGGTNTMTKAGKDGGSGGGGGGVSGGGGSATPPGQGNPGASSPGANGTFGRRIFWF